ncbi:MAG: MFS transporter [Planctomycetota bacterium]|nr:MFS transporter [Planctomycetota bacterium]
MNRYLKYVLLTALYLSQGLPFGFFVQALPVLLRKQGLSLGQIGLTSLLALPWALKFLWAPIVDLYGKRRTWILILQSLAILLLIGVSLIEAESQLPLLFVAVLLTNLIAATQDIATDGLAVDLLTNEERGIGNGIQVAGYRVGMILGGGLILMVYPTIGWMGAFIGMACVLALATVPVILVKSWPERKEQGSEEMEETNVLRALWQQVYGFFNRKGVLKWCGVLVIFKMGDYLAGGVLKPWMSDLKLSVADIGFYVGLGGFIAGLLGAVVGGLLLTYLGRLRGLIVFGGVQALSLGAYIFIEYTGRTGWELFAACSFEHFTGGLATVALFTCMMDACRPGCGGTDYTIQASLVVFATGLAGALGGYLADAVGYQIHFSLSVVFALFCLMITAYWARGKSKDGHWVLDESQLAESAVKAEINDD